MTIPIPKSLLSILCFLTILFQINAGYTAEPRIASGALHSAVLKSDGSLRAWGNNEHGQLGNDSTVDSHSPVSIGADHDWSDVAAGGSHTLALKNDGSLWAWGNNCDGQLGDGSTVDRLAPVRIGLDNDWTAITAGGSHSLALKSDGSLWAWGNNEYGQLGDGSTVERHSPVRIMTLIIKRFNPAILLLLL